MLSFTSHHHIVLLPTTQTLPPSLPLLLTRRRRRYPITATSAHTPLSTATSDHTPPSTASFPSSAIRRIAQKLRSLGFTEKVEPRRHPSGPGTAGEIFIPTPLDIPSRQVGHTLDASWSSPENPVPLPGKGSVLHRLRMATRQAAWERRQEARSRKKREPLAAEKLIGAEELLRLRRVGVALRKRLKIGKAGVTEGVVNGIHERWRKNEVVKIKCEELCRVNMRRTHETLEIKTGGLVIWRSGSSILLYRGVDYRYPYFTEGDTLSSVSVATRLASEQEESLSCISQANDIELSKRSHNPSLVVGVGYPKKFRSQLSGEAKLEAETNQILDGLGPRFTDWWDYGPLPVDADLLPRVVRGFRKPFRLLPFGVQPKLTDRELASLKWLARPLPCHFALGRNRNLQGLASSMLKLWERCEVAKIAVKRGVQNTNSKLMTEELKQLTGGTLLQRDRDFFIFYRGKDFLPLAVSSAIAARRKNLLQIDGSLPKKSPLVPQTLEKTNIHTTSAEKKIKKTKPILESVEAKISKAIAKKLKAEKMLEEIEGLKGPLQPETDKEAISQEERYMLRKIGLKMKPFLLLGIRGAFDGTVENMHLHWKYRELVKVISKNICAEEVHATARMLETASGGILVALERVNMGYAIIMYRGKNYIRPTSLRPQTLLNKKEAHKLYLEKQRSRSLKFYILSLDHKIEQMKHKLGKHDKEELLVHSTKLNFSDGICESLNSTSVSYAPRSGGNQIEDKMENIRVEDKMPTIPMEAGSEVMAAKHLQDLVDIEHDESFANVKVSEPSSNISFRPNVMCTEIEDNMENIRVEEKMPTIPMEACSEHVQDLVDIERDESFANVKVTEPSSDISFWPNVMCTENEDKMENIRVEDKMPTIPMEACSEVMATKIKDKMENIRVEDKMLTIPMEACSEHLQDLIDIEHDESFANVKVTEPSSDILFRPNVMCTEGEECGNTSALEITNFDLRSYGASDDDLSTSKEESSSISETFKVDLLGDDTKSIGLAFETPMKVSTLSNKERLILRRQALKMRYRPVLAVGKSNDVTGVAKTIKVHFRKYPLAIVNIKGIAKGTSVQQVIFDLEKATGAVMVSREPSKVILYRGWGAGIYSNGSRKGRSGKSNVHVRKTISPALLNAVRMESGLQSGPDRGYYRR